MFLEQLPKLRAEHALLDVQISSFPHWSGTKADPDAGDRSRREFVSRFQTALLQPGRKLVDQYGRELDAQGRIVLKSGADIRRWFRAEGKLDAG